MSTQRKLIRLRAECSDPRVDHSEIDADPDDIFIPTPGAVLLGSLEHLMKQIRKIAQALKVDERELLAILMPHHPCAAVPEPWKSTRFGMRYAQELTGSGIPAVSLFLGQEIKLHNPTRGTLSNSDMQRLFEEASVAKSGNYNKKEQVQVSEVAVLPFFTRGDLSPNTLCITSGFFGLEGIMAIGRVLGGKFPHRNYHSSITAQEREMFEAGFAAASAA